MNERPALIAVDDEPTVARAVERDLRRRYAEAYRVLRAESGGAALDLIGRVLGRGEEVALLLTDQRMPEMTGVELLARARAAAPEAKRVLLTAYADTDAAIRAINEVQLDHYLLKPWDPPEELLYPVLDDLLGDWQASRQRPLEQVQVVGLPWAPASHQVRSFLTRNLVPYRWVDVEGAEGAALLAARGLATDRLPVLLFPDGKVAEAPSLAEVAAGVGLRTHAQSAVYDLAIVGGGPAGLAAAVYGASEGLRAVLVEGEAMGGQAGQSSRIENYLGFPVGLSGSDLARRAIAQASRLGAELVTTRRAVRLERGASMCLLELDDGDRIAAHAVLIATGVTYRLLEVPGVAELTGAGIYYGAAASEARALAGRDVVIVGGANSAGQAAVYFSRFARSVTILYRGESLRRGMSHYLVEQIEAIPTIAVRLGAEVAAAHGAGRLEAVEVTTAGGPPETLPAAGMFVFIGARPATDWLEGAVARSRQGFVLAGAQVREGDATARPWPLEREPLPLETSIPGVFVAGDVREGSIKRVASAVGEGSMAVQLVHRYLARG